MKNGPQQHPLGRALLVAIALAFTFATGAAAEPPVWTGRRGSSSATTTTSIGSSTGTAPTNQATKRSGA